MRRVEIERVDQLARARERRAIDLLPLAIELLELARDRVRLVIVLRHQQLDAAQRVAEAPDGVQSRREDEADASRGERLALEPRRANERAQAGVRRVGHAA